MGSGSIPDGGTMKRMYVTNVCKDIRPYSVMVSTTASKPVGLCSSRSMGANGSMV